MSIAGPFYTYSQLEQLWIQNGGPAGVAPVAAAIALAESQGGAGSLNPTDNGGRQTSWGLWQDSNGTHGQPAPNILDPNVNAQVAVAKYHGAGDTFRPWGTWSSGAYLAHLQSGVPPSSAGVPAGSGTATLTSDTTPAPGSADSTCLIGIPSGVPLAGGACLLTKSEARAIIGGLLVGAGVLIGLVAAVILTRGTSAPQALAHRLTSRAPRAVIDSDPADDPADEDENP